MTRAQLVSRWGFLSLLIDTNPEGAFSPALDFLQAWKQPHELLQLNSSGPHGGLHEAPLRVYPADHFLLAQVLLRPHFLGIPPFTSLGKGAPYAR